MTDTPWRRSVPCVDCNRRGHGGTGRADCLRCNGRGWIVVEYLSDAQMKARRG